MQDCNHKGGGRSVENPASTNELPLFNEGPDLFEEGFVLFYQSVFSPGNGEPVLYLCCQRFARGLASFLHISVMLPS